MFIQKLEQQSANGSLKNPAIVYNVIKGRGIEKYRSYGYGYGYTEEIDNQKWWKKIFG